MKNIIITSFFLLIRIISISQEKVELNNQDGVYISYELTKLNGTDKKDKYLIMVKAQNKNEYDVFYSIPNNQTSDQGITSILQAVQKKYFSELIIRNSSGMSKDGVKIKGTETEFKTNDNSILYKIEKDQIISLEDEFTIKAGEKPIVTNAFAKTLKKLEKFDIAVSKKFINGDWGSNCGNSLVSLTLIENTDNTVKLLQTINGKQIYWKKVSANSFARETDSGTTLSYNSGNNSFNYSTSDGVSCVWTKK